MCKQFSRTFRPEHRDVEVVYLDDFGVEKRLYVGLASPAGPVDVDTVVQKHFAEEDKLAEKVRWAITPRPREVETPTWTVSTALPGAPAGEESAKPPEAKPEPIATPKRPRTRRKGK